MNIPHGTPSNACPTTSKESESAWINAISQESRHTSRKYTTYEERDKDGSIHKNESQEIRPAVTKTIGNWTNNKNANKGATLASLEERTLPFCRNGLGSLSRNLDSVSFLESGKSDKVTVQEHVEGLHDLFHVSYQSECKFPHEFAAFQYWQPWTYNRKTKDKSPKTGRRMIFGSLPQPHLMFAQLSILRISHELLVLKDLGMVAADALLPHRFVYPRLLIVLGIGEARHLAGA